jgi:hypothetical protein
MPLSLLVWIRGYAGEAQRNSLRASVDGSLAAHHLERGEAGAELLVVEAVTSRGFTRLDIEVCDTTGTEGDEAAGVPPDPRKRGICFDSYGWRWC